MKIYHGYMITLLGLWSNLSLATPLNTPLSQLQHQWAVCEYQIKGEDSKQSCFQDLVDEEQQHLTLHPNNPDLNIAFAINLASLANVSSTSDALSLIKQAKTRLEALKNTTSGQRHTAVLVTLGALYYRAPGWPISFGDDDKAGVLLAEAIKLSPDDITAHYFYGDFLAEQGQTQQAINVLKQGLQIETHHVQPLVVQGRKQDIQRLLSTLQD
ncbi:tetratricopeptide repeat protein [Vibrio zhugei]|uniref:Tetratricopeptide repeat protein n=1 Tax=Vibrio zhugei TaxID=2479546 RepID=A0ABV7C766_9VIBR|nr:tetratricopeptide repeat protein [Vibrio zhugei]